MDAIVAVVDATNLRMNLRLVLELQRLGRPVIVALNMTDVARARGLAIDVAKLSAELAARWWKPWRCSTTATPNCWPSS